MHMMYLTHYYIYIYAFSKKINNLLKGAFQPAIGWKRIPSQVSQSHILKYTRDRERERERERERKESKWIIWEKIFRSKNIIRSN